MRVPVMAALLGLGSVLLTQSPASATPITYELTGTMSGTLGEASFTNVAFTLDTVADTANITSFIFPVDGVGGILIYENPGVTTITIAGIGTATFTTDSVGAFSQDFGVLQSGVEAVGMADITALSGIAYVFGSYATSVYDLSTPFSASSGVGGNLASFSTTLGTLTVASWGEDVGTFTASMVPEPATLSVFALGVLGSLVAGRRRNASARIG